MSKIWITFHMLCCLVGKCKMWNKIQIVNSFTTILTRQCVSLQNLSNQMYVRIGKSITPKLRFQYDINLLSDLKCVSQTWLRFEISYYISNSCLYMCIIACIWNVFPFSASSWGIWKICIYEYQIKAQGFKRKM